MRLDPLIAMGVFLLAIPAFAASPAVEPDLDPGLARGADYFPLQVGNRWVYGGGNNFVASVNGTTTAGDGQRYFLLDGFRSAYDPTRLVRTTRGNRVIEFNPDGLEPNLWYLLGAPVGTSWTITIEPPFGPLDECVTGATITVGSRNEVVTVRAGTFRNVVRLVVGNPCFDFGTVAEWFAPKVGLIKRADVTFFGIVFTELIEAEVGDVSLPTPRYGARLSLEQMDYVYDPAAPAATLATPVVRGTFKMVNRTDAPLTLEFAGCKSVSIVVRDASGVDLVNARGDDGTCCPACTEVESLTLTDGILVLPFTFPLRQADGSPLPDGRYALEATLETLDAAPLRISASVMIEVRSAP